jgi:hypothetical protein
MVNERALKNSFRKAKEDVEGVKNELAFALKRIAKIEDLLTRQAIEQTSKRKIKKNSKIKRKIIEY